jgi:hypothetical protein
MKKVLCLITLIAFSFSSASAIYSRPRVSPQNSYERLIAIVPMIGTGAPEDPRRPMFTPANGVDGSRQGLLGFSFQISDDENYALVEFVGMNRAAFKEILAEAKSGVKIFQRGKFKKEDLATAWGLHKREFNLENLGVRLP